MIPFERHPRHPRNGRFGHRSTRAVQEVLGIGADQPCLPESASPRPPRRAWAPGAWLIGPASLLAIAAGASVVIGGVEGIFGIFFGVLLALGMGWILVSVLMPAKADRTCPSCARKGLERLDRASTSGLACKLCGWSDATASSFLLAEEEGPLEDIVLRERRSRHKRF